MNLHSPRPDRSPEAVAARKRATDQARAMNARQGYVHDPLLEDATAAYVAGDLTRDEYRARIMPASSRGNPPPRCGIDRPRRAGDFILMVRNGGRSPDRVLYLSECVRGSRQTGRAAQQAGYPVESRAARPVRRAHLKAIHGRFFQDVYGWAGHTRNETPMVDDDRVEPIGGLSKGETAFLDGCRIEMGLNEALKPVSDANVLRRASREEFMTRAAQALGELH